MATVMKSFNILVEEVNGHTIDRKQKGDDGKWFTWVSIPVKNLSKTDASALLRILDKMEVAASIHSVIEKERAT